MADIKEKTTTHILTNSDLEEYITAKPRTREIPGYFDDNGKFTRGPFFTACLGKKTVGMRDMPGYIREAGAYMWQGAALDAAKAFQVKCQELLDERLPPSSTDKGE